MTHTHTHNIHKCPALHDLSVAQVRSLVMTKQVFIKYTDFKKADAPNNISMSPCTLCVLAINHPPCEQPMNYIFLNKKDRLIHVDVMQSHPLHLGLGDQRWELISANSCTSIDHYHNVHVYTSNNKTCM